MYWFGDIDFRVLSFMSEGVRSRYQQYSDETFERLCKVSIVWDEDKTNFQKRFVIDAESWKPRLLFPDEPVEFTSDKHFLKECRVDPNNCWAYANRIFKRGAPLELWQGHKRGIVGFTDDVVIPVLIKSKSFTTCMSITPAECLSQRPGIRKATGKVLIGGLGLGWLLRKVAQKRSVKEIIIVEINENLLNWYGYNLCKEIESETGKPITIICDDVLNHIGQHGNNTRHLVDIWDSYPTETWELSDEWRDKISSVEYFWGWGLFGKITPRKIRVKNTVSILNKELGHDKRSRMLDSKSR